ncbi:MAG: alpha/beta fold hydrolase [Sphingosinicella sp.]|nr:alpha/beta fold hydrolase [Sphingosinicella sp.]
MLRRETANDPQRLARALKGLRLYQEAARTEPLPLMPAINEAHGATLRDYGGAGRPVLFIPSLINPPNILDLSEEMSLLRWLVRQGHHVLLVDWGSDVDARATLSVAGHVEEILLPFVRSLTDPPALVGYCLGGTMAIAVAALVPVRSLALIATPWHFSAYSAESRERLLGLWRSAKPIADAMGVLPTEVLQAAFWQLNPAAAVSKFERIADAEPKTIQAFVRLEDWANDGPPLPLEAARELFEDFFERDLPGAGEWQVDGAKVRLDNVTGINFISRTDQIVPAGSAAHSLPGTLLDKGHVGMVIGSEAALLWEPLADFLET